jgi:heme-degrading monooxygenase HmoA
MFIAMNRFRIASSKEADFIEIWKNRDSRLEEVPGFLSFNLLQGPKEEDATLFVSHTMWASAEDFENWTQSEAFRQAHANAGSKTQDIYLGPPRFEGFESVL